MAQMAEPTRHEQPATMNPERAQVIIGLFRAAHPDAAAEIGHLVDTVIHGLGDDIPDVGKPAQGSGASVSPQAARAAVEFVMAAMLAASR
jgi:hypothetical protein